MSYKWCLRGLFFKYTVLLSYVFLLLSTVGCDFLLEADENLVRSELVQLNNDIQAGLLSPSSWNVLMRLGQTSSETRRFLGQMQNIPNFESFIPSRTLDFIESIQSQMMIDRFGRVNLTNIEKPVMPEMVDIGAFAEVIEDEYRDIQQSDEVYTYEIIDKFYRREHFCRDQCQCYAYRLGQVLKRANFDGVILNSRISGGDFGVIIERSYWDDNRVKSWYLYHVGLIIVDRHFRVGVIDPIMFGDVDIRSLSSWYDRIEGAEVSLKVSFY